MSRLAAVYSIAEEDDTGDDSVQIRSKKKRRIEVSSSSSDEEQHAADNMESTQQQSTAASSSANHHSPSSSPPRRLSRLRRASFPAADDNGNGMDEEDHQERKQEGEKKKPSNARRSTRASSSMDVSDDVGSEEHASSDSERKSPSEGGRKYGLRGSARAQKLNDSEKSALERLLRDRAKASVGDADDDHTSSSPHLKRKRLFQSNAAAASSSASAEKKGTSEADRQAKYDRLERIIHKDDKQYSESGEDMEDPDYEDEQEEKDKAPSRWKASYSAEKEAAELRKVERAEAARAEELDRNREAIREEKFERFKAREEKKKNTRQGKGQSTTKRASAKKRKESQDDGDYDDDFVVPDDEMEEESYDSAADEYMHQQFDEEQFIEEERQMSGRMMEASITPRDAFELWCRYLCGTIIEADYTGVIDRTTRLRVKFAAAMKLIEEQFNMKVNQWVKSQTWERKDCADILHRMNSLAYSTSMEATAIVGCEVCLPKKGHAHQATHALSYFGVEYEPKELHHPFRESKIIIGKVYEQHTFNTGVLCHQRLKLFHVMKHFKLHVMLTLKARMKKLCTDSFNESEPPTRAICYQMMEAVLKDVATINSQFKIWDRLRAIAESYSTSDSRKVFVDLDFLNSCQDFDHEECLLELFSWRRVGAKDGFSVSEHIIRTEQERDQKMAARLENTRRVAVGADEEDEYEVDEEAEEEAAEAERQEKQKRKKRSKHSRDDEDDLDEEDYELLREAETTAASVSAAAAVESSIQQQHKQQITSSLANLAADKLKNGVGNGQSSLSSMWHRRKSETPPATASSAAQSSAPTVIAASSSHSRSHLPPPSSAESIQDESDVEVVAPPSAGTWRRKATLSFSHAASSSNSPPKATQSSSSATPPVSATRTTAPPKTVDGEGLFELYKGLHEEEQINFLQLAGAIAEKSHLIAFVKAAPQQFRTSVREFIEEAEGVL